MRKKVIFLVLFIMVVAIASAETKLSMELWNRWTYKMVDGADDAAKNEFAFKRGYLRLEPVLSSKIKGRFNLDFFSDDGPDDGAGLKIKYAYLDFSGYLWKDAKFTFGLMKNYFGTIYDWAYETIDKDPSDKYKFASSTDYGMGISGYLPKGFGEYQVALYNGEGYKKTGGDIDINPAFLVNFRVSPIVGLTLGGSYAMDTQAKSYDYTTVEGTETVYDTTGVWVYDEINGEYNWEMQVTETELDVTEDHEVDYDKTVNKMAAVGRLTMIPNVDIRAQYLTRTETSKKWDGSAEEEVEKTVNAISIMPIINMLEWTGIDMELVFRYDMYDDDADLDDDDEDSEAYDTVITGINYYMLRDGKNKPKLWLQGNYQMKQFKDEEKDSETEMMLQLRWKFSETL